MTALQLPTLDVPLPLPKKKKIPLPLEPVVPIYKFELPDIKAEILSLGKDALSKLGLPVTLVRSLCPWTQSIGLFAAGLQVGKTHGV